MFLRSSCSLTGLVFHLFCCHISCVSCLSLQIKLQLEKCLECSPRFTFSMKKHANYDSGENIIGEEENGSG
jgi:hypothetical protein